MNLEAPTQPGAQQSAAPQWWHIKVREKGKRAYWLLSGKGGLNRLRIHAAIFRDKSQAGKVLAEIIRENPDLEAKITW